MITGFKDSESLLYHYTTIGTARDHILKDGTLRMGSFRRMNDPKESKSWEFALGSNENRDLGAYSMSALSKRLSDIFKDNTRAVCFCRDVGPLSGNHLDDIAKRGFARPRMWAQYAGGHAGLCLVFDRRRLEECVADACPDALRLYAGAVTYRDRGVVLDLNDGDYFISVDHLERLGFEEYWKVHLHQFSRRLLFEKMEDWRDEKEFRFVAVLDQPRDVFVHFKDSLVGVAFGDATSDDDAEAVIQLLPQQVEIMRIIWKNCSPWYDFGNPRFNRSLRNSPWFKKTAQPGATDNPDDAQRLREDH